MADYQSNPVDALRVLFPLFQAAQPGGIEDIQQAEAICTTEQTFDLALDFFIIGIGLLLY